MSTSALIAQGSGPTQHPDGRRTSLFEYAGAAIGRCAGCVDIINQKNMTTRKLLSSASGQSECACDFFSPRVRRQMSQGRGSFLASKHIWGDTLTGLRFNRARNN
jgi:hypothetical protein